MLKKNPVLKRKSMKSKFVLDKIFSSVTSFRLI
jgi:hypothetical protein